VGHAVTSATRSWADEALSNAQPTVFWSDRNDAPEAAPGLVGRRTADLVIIGGGFTGLWAAIQAVEETPGLNVVLLEAERCGFGASSRNGGFCDASLTHGLANSISKWPDETELLLRLGRENLEGIESTIQRHGIDADFRRAAEIGVATKEWQLPDLEADIETYRSVGANVELLDGTQMQARLSSPTYLGAMVRHEDVALLDPARLCWGLRRVAQDLGVKLYENSAVQDISGDGSQLCVTTHNGSVRGGRVVMATNAYRGLVRSPGRYVIPVYDHVLMTEPLDAAQLESIGWLGREGLSDVSNQFHYYRMTEDSRILWGGYDALYYFNNGVGPEHDQNDATHKLLSEHFFETFPQLQGLRFTHRWGGPIGTTTRFTPTWGTAHDGRLVWAAGYTGLGVGASRFGARVALDLVMERDTERTQLQMVQKKPLPFPPEPLRWAGVQLTRRSIQRADANNGKRGPWLALLDRFGVGFDS
jgi:glycine/D-amino acid oxidase-like deaminating enzyme